MSEFAYVGSIVAMIVLSVWIGWTARGLVEDHRRLRLSILGRVLRDAERLIAKSFLGGSVKW